MKALLHGKPFRHPLHTYLVHFPMGLWMLSFVLDAFTWFVDPSSTAVAAAYYSMAAGTALAFIAAIPGFVDYMDIRRDHPARPAATWHMLLNLTAVLVFSVNTYIRAGHVEAMKTPLPLFLLSAAGVGLILISGYLGGLLIYDKGIGVGRHRRNYCSPHRTIHINTFEPVHSRGREGNHEFFYVCPKSDLGEKDILRVAVGGYVAMIARVGEQVYAVQDFCTHRSAPLSEGRICDGELQCPWHNSRFDLRSGKVTRGPAKVDLKTYPIRLQGNEVQIGIISMTAPAG